MILLMRNRILAAFVTFHMVLLVTSPAMAGVIPSKWSTTQASGYDVQKDIDSIQLALETRIIKEKLLAYGFSSEEVAAKLSTMDPNQIHLLAGASSDVLAGGETGTVIAIVVIIAIVIAVLGLTGTISKVLHK